MARTVTSSDDLQEISKRLSFVVKSIDDCIATMAASGMKKCLIHTTKMKTTDLPNLESWVITVEADVKDQVRAYRDGVMSRAELNKHRAAMEKARDKKQSDVKKIKKTKG